MKDLIKDIRVHDADPGEGVKMEIAFFDVAVEGAPFVSTDFQLNPYSLELFFQGLGNSSE